MEENAPHNSFLYIDSYVIVKSAMSHVEYVLKGSLLQKDIQRRYSEFFLLREKIIERWPCIYIPELPPKQATGNLEENFIKLRMRLLNHFLDRLSEIKDVFNGDEVKLFILYEENKKTGLKLRVSEMLQEYNITKSSQQPCNYKVEKVRQTESEMTD